MCPESPLAVLFSDDAVSKVRDLIVEEGNPNLMLRVSVSGGGCSGFQYGFAFEQQSEEADLVFEKEGVRVLIDPISLQYLRGAHVDFQEAADGSRFVIKNPNAKSTCGCGSSFSTADNGNTNGNTADGKSCASRTPVDR
ncbi:MAG: iron-sulfur cluster insertion protein ErpA [Steroidobacteraceae bacterium]|jgi:iron-sulfur cluster insertion protein